MKRKQTFFLLGFFFLMAFALWTVLIQRVDVQAIGPNGTSVGFGSFNFHFHTLTGVHMTLYHITDWLGLVPVAVCLFFGGVGFLQWVRRKRLRLVDIDILLLGVYYIIVVCGYLIFEKIPINYRPVLISGFLEVSYPSSTTLLVLSVMPTLTCQADLRCNRAVWKKAIRIFVCLFSSFMVLGRLYSGVHWATDIIGSVFLSAGLFSVYLAAIA